MRAPNRRRRHRMYRSMQTGLLDVDFSSFFLFNIIIIINFCCLASLTDCDSVLNDAVCVCVCCSWCRSACVLVSPNALHPGGAESFIPSSMEEVLHITYSSEV